MINHKSLNVSDRFSKAISEYKFHATAILFTKNTEAVTRRCSAKKVLLKISENSREITCARVSFLIKLKNIKLIKLKKRLWHRCFPVNFPKFLRTTFLLEHLWRLLLKIIKKSKWPKYEITKDTILSKILKLGPDGTTEILPKLFNNNMRPVIF